MKIYYDLIFISTILIIILICLFFKKYKKKHVEAFKFKIKRRRGKGIKKKMQNVLLKSIHNRPTVKCPQCPDCNCPPIQLSQTVSSDVQLQNLLDVYIKEGLDRIIETKSYDNININSDEEANTYLKQSQNQLQNIINTISEYNDDVKNTLDQVLPFSNNVAIITSDTDDSEVRITRNNAKYEIESFISKVKLLHYITEQMGFYNKFFYSVVQS